MNRSKLLCLLLAIVMVASLPVSIQAAENTAITYSTEYNAGYRDQLCEGLSHGAEGYYTGEYAYNSLASLPSGELLEVLRELMTVTHTYKTSYDECRDLAPKVDSQGEEGTILLLYTGFVTDMSEYINNSSKGGWNREHVWPKSLGGFNTTGAGSDLHHIRPTDKSVNGKRGNDKYGVTTNGNPINGTATVEGAVGGYTDGPYFEPLDNVKGDVARICLYVYVRYGGELSKCSNITNVFQSVDVLLDWMASDPVDTWEMGRNEVVGAIQGNRNVFIDYPELAWLLFDREIPEDLVTPSGATACEHTNVVTENKKDATCGKDGYSGDTCCADCGILLESGEKIPSSGSHSFGEWEVVRQPSEGKKGIMEQQCTVCGRKNQQTFEAEPTSPVIWIVAAGAAVLVIGGVTIVLLRKKRS